MPLDSGSDVFLLVSLQLLLFCGKLFTDLGKLFLKRLDPRLEVDVVLRLSCCL